MARWGDGGERGAALEACWDDDLDQDAGRPGVGCAEVLASHQRIADPSSVQAKPSRKQCRAQWRIRRNQTLRGDGCELAGHCASSFSATGAKLKQSDATVAAAVART